MNNNTILFTGMSVDFDKLRNQRIIRAPFPSTFTRVETSVNNLFMSDWYDNLNTWLIDNIAGCFGVYQKTQSAKVIIFFEDQNDAILFRLLGGSELLMSY